MTILLEAQPRTHEGKKVKLVRKDHAIPAVVYGHGFETMNLQVPRNVFESLLHKKKIDALLDLKVGDGEVMKVIVKDMQRDPRTYGIVHIDFHRVRLTEKMTTDVTLEFVGESPAVKEKFGILVKAMNELKVECLPQDLPSAITVDITKLINIHDSIHVRDLTIPQGVEVLDQGDEVVATVQQQREEEVETAAPVEDVSKVEVVGEKKEEAGEEAGKEEKE